MLRGDIWKSLFQLIWFCKVTKNMLNIWRRVQRGEGERGTTGEAGRRGPDDGLVPLEGRKEGRWTSCYQ